MQHEPHRNFRQPYYADSNNPFTQEVLIPKTFITLAVIPTTAGFHPGMTGTVIVTNSGSNYGG